MSLRYGYVTNGLRDHRLLDALALLADCGYAGVGLTLDHDHLDPYADDLPAQVDRVRSRLAELDLAVVVETGARYLLDPARKHFPTLLHETDDRARRVDLLRRAVDVAADLGAPAVSFWSGIRPPEVPEQTAWERLREGCEQLLEHAERRGVELAFEPEPGMLVDRLDAFDRLVADLGEPERLRLTLDVGHCQCLEDLSPADCVRRSAGRLAHVQIEDMRRGVHEHLPFGEGEVDVPDVLGALRDVGYDGLVAVELSRHSHTAHTMVPAAISFLCAAEDGAR